MKHYMTDLKPAKICAPRVANGIMEVEQEFVTSDMALTKSAKPVLADALQGQDGNYEHLHEAGEYSTAPSIWVGKEAAIMSDDDEVTGSLNIAVGDKGQPSVEIDMAKYQAHLDDPSLSDEQKEEIIKALWSIMMAFVDLGFGVHPAQEVCGKQGSKLDVSQDKDSNESKPVDKLTIEFERASDDT